MRPTGTEVGDEIREASVAEMKTNLISIEGRRSSHGQVILH